MIQLAWRFLQFQKDSELARWYRARTDGGARKTTMIVALARKLLVELWRLELPQGKFRKASCCTQPDLPSQQEEEYTVPASARTRDGCR